ncbi:MAG: hypothetical protein RBT33_00735 [Candidatus Dojkabacteria bacterium]|jgi:hypothetical protein|nr:hypothetical protein [Candidatus Dojkabacteria bacterium]
MTTELEQSFDTLFQLGNVCFASDSAIILSFTTRWKNKVSIAAMTAAILAHHSYKHLEDVKTTCVDLKKLHTQFVASCVLSPNYLGNLTYETEVPLYKFDWNRWDDSHIRILLGCELPSFLTEDNGFDEEEQEQIKALEKGESCRIGMELKVSRLS